MSPVVLFTIGTLCLWASIGLLTRSVIHIWRYARLRDGLLLRTLRWEVSIGIGLGLIAAICPMNLGRDIGSYVPILWPVLTPFGWAGAWMIVIAGVNAVRLWTAVGEDEATRARRGIAIWGIAGALILGYCRLNGMEMQILRGGIPFRLPILVLGMLLLVGGILVMQWLSTRSKAHYLASLSLRHFALILGCIVFTIPFAWMVSTGLKEERDLVFTGSPVWIPKIQQTVPYYDPVNPVYESDTKLGHFVGPIIERNADGSVRLDLIEPKSMTGQTRVVPSESLKEFPRQAPLVLGQYKGTAIKGFVTEEMNDGRRRVRVLEPAELKDTEFADLSSKLEPIRKPGLRWQNYAEVVGYLPEETHGGMTFVQNTLLLVVLSTLGTVLSCSLVAYAFARMRFLGRDRLFLIVLSTMMLPGAVTMLPKFLIFRGLGWIDTLLPLWVPTFFGGAFNIFLLRQFFMTLPRDLDDAAKIDGCSHWAIYSKVLMPQIKPALIVVGLTTFIASWNDFMGPLIYISSPERMPISYALQLFQSDYGTQQNLVMAMTTMAILPVLVLFAVMQKFFVDGAVLTGLGGR